MRVARELQSADADVRLRALDSLSAELAAGVAPLGTEVTGLLHGCLGDSVKRVQRRAAEVMAQAAAADSHIESLIAESLGAPDPGTRWGAAFSQAALGRVSLEAAEIWIDRLASSDRDLRWAAHDLIVRHVAKLPRALDRLRAAAGGEDAGRAKMALYCLRDLGIVDDLHQELALRGLEHGDIGVRLAALSALPSVVPDTAPAATVLCAYLGDADVRMRRAVAATLGNLGVTSAAVDAGLRQALDADDTGLQRAAAGALRKLRGEK